MRTVIRRISVIGVVAIVSLVVPLSAQRVSDLELKLKEALHKQQVEGDAYGAIALYREIVSTAGANRAVAAKALLEMASLYERLGRETAETVYQQIVREFADQPAATAARARLAALRPSTAKPVMRLERVEQPIGIQNIVASDGERAIYWDATRTILYFGDLTGAQQTVVQKTNQFPRVYASRDLSMVLFIYPLTAQGGVRLAVVRNDGSGYREVTPTEDGRPLEMSLFGPSHASWSWDKRHVVLGVNGRLLRMSVADGKLLDLVPREAVRGDRAEFSPDDRYVAYDLGFPIGIGLVSASGGDGKLVTSTARFIDWTRDGGYLLAGDLSGQMFTLTAIPVKEGHVSQERIPLRTVPLGHVATLMNGALLVTVADGNLLARQVSLGTLDAATKTLTWRNLELVGVPLPFANPSWSPDGTRFTYMTRENTGPILIQRIVNLSTGTDDELLRHPRLTGCVWGRSRPELFCGRTTDRNTTEIIAIHPDTKSVDHIGEAGSRVIMDHMRADGRTLVTVDGSKGIMLEWDLASSQQVYTTYYPSEDGRMELGVVREGPNQGVMRVRPKNGSEDQWRLLVPRRLPAQGNNAIPVKFTPDSAWIVFHDRRDDGRDSLYRISTQSAELERIGDYPTSSPISVLSISPDGTKFIVNAPAPRKTPELLIMHNPVPAGPRPATTTPTSPRK